MSQALPMETNRYTILISKFEKIVFGPEDLIVDYLTLADDPNGNLQESYTVCSSGTPWYSLDIFSIKIYDDMSENLVLNYDNPTSGKFETEYLTSSQIPIVPNSWYHICMGLDTVSGLLRIVVNGVVLVNEEKDYFRNTMQWKPNSLAQKVLIFKSYKPGFWYQHRGIISNLNIFSSMMSVEDMVTRTAGGEDCSSPGDYIRQENTLMKIS